MSFLVNWFRIISKYSNKLYRYFEYTTINIQGRDVVLPSFMLMMPFYGFGYQKLNLVNVYFHLFTQLVTNYGEIYSTYAKWGTTAMFYSCSSGFYSSKSLFATYDMLTKYNIFKELMATYVSDVYVDRDVDLAGYVKCERSLRIHRFSGYITLLAIIFYSYQPVTNLVYGAKSYTLGVEYPFDVVYNTMNFVIFFVITTIAMFVRATFISNYYMIMNYMLTHISYRLDEQSATLMREEEATEVYDKAAYKKKLISVIKNHQRLIRFSKRVEKMYTFCVFTQFVTDALPLCSVGIYLILERLPVLEYFKLVLFLVLILSQQYANCLSGERLKQSSMRIGEAAYNCNWTNKSTKINAYLKLLMLRAQIPLKITGLNFFELSMETFSMVCKRTMNYFTILKTFFDK